MRGDVSEMLLIVVVGVIVVLVMYQFFVGSGSAEPPPITQSGKPTCRENSNCDNNHNGKLCMSVQGSSYFCGCLDNSDCPLSGQQCLREGCSP